MATAMIRSDAPKGETIDEGSSGQLGPPPATNGDKGPATFTTNGVGVASTPSTTSHEVNVTAGTVRIEIIITAGSAAPSVSIRQGEDGGATEKGTSIAVPTLKTPSVVAKLADGEHELKYQNFSLVMHAKRRLCLFTAANIDNAPLRRRPDLSRKYGRAALGGLGPKDTEAWFTDPRLPEQFQLPDRFFTKDGGAFDRGHVVMRESVCWGDSYTTLRRANGDTYHTTNCTPQVAGFNQSSQLGRWGQLENELARRLKQERMSVFAGPILSKDGWWFDGVDDKGSVRVQIPSRFWKLVVGHRDGKLIAFAFRLEQDLTSVPLQEELDLDPEAWRDELVSVAALDKELRELAFPDVIRDADQYKEELGKAMTDELGLAPGG